jgi:formate dehydrogenase major subunit
MAQKHRFAPLARLTEPMVRDNGELRTATWTEALTRAAAGLQSVANAAGSQAVGFFSCSKSTNELNFIAQKFARVVIGTNNIDSCNRT